jgi:hypothetical protein
VRFVKRLVVWDEPDPSITVERGRQLARRIQTPAWRPTDRRSSRATIRADERIQLQAEHLGAKLGWAPPDGG